MSKRTRIIVGSAVALLGMFVVGGMAGAASTATTLQPGDTLSVKCNGTKLTWTRVDTYNGTLGCNGSSTTTTTAPPTTTTTAPSTTTTTTAPSGTQTYWAPTIGAQWQWQLTTPVDTSVNVPVYDIDVAENAASVVSGLHAQGRHVIGYVDVGGAEPYRADYTKFTDLDAWYKAHGQEALILNKMSGWNEYYVNIRHITDSGMPAGTVGASGTSYPNGLSLAGIEGARFDEAKSKGFDAIEPDVVDTYSNKSGLALTYNDQITYNRTIANMVHARGMSVLLKGDIDQVKDLVTNFDFTLNEQCYQYSECDLLKPFIAAGKAVLHVEYSTDPAKYCPVTVPMGFSSMKKNLNLDAWRQPC